MTWVLEKKIPLQFFLYSESNVSATQGHKMPSKLNDNMKRIERDSQYAGVSYLQLALKSIVEGVFLYYLGYKMPP